MQRIAPRDKLPTHPECDVWLTELMIDLKLRAAGEEYTNFPTKRLQEWQIHRARLDCWDTDPAWAFLQHGTIPKRHGAAIAFFDALIADIAQGAEITTERIVEADRHWDNIVSCRELRAIYY